MTILKAVFGNVLNVANFISKITKQEAVNDIQSIFYNSFQIVLKERTQREDSHDISFLLSLERKKVISFFEVEIENDPTFEELFSDGMLNRLSEELIKILDDYPQWFNLELCKEIILDSLKKFHSTIFNQLSEKQGIYILLQKALKDSTTLNDLVLNVQNSHTKIEKELSAINSKLDSLLTKNQHFSIAQKIINPIIKDLHLEANVLVEKKEFEKAIFKYEQALKLLEAQGNKNNKSYFNIHTNIGLCHQLNGAEDKAALCFIEAVKYDEENSTALFHAYLGHYELKNEEDCQKVEKEIFEKHKDSQEALLLKLFLSRIDQTIELIAIEIEVKNRFPKSIELHYGIARAYIEKGNLSKYVVFMERAIQLSPPKETRLRIMLAANLSAPHCTYFSLHEKKQLSDEIRKDLDKAIELYEEVWEILKENSNRKYSSLVPMNISTIYATKNNFEMAIHWSEIGILSYSSDYYIGHKVLYLYLSNKMKEAFDCCLELKDILDPLSEQAFLIYLQLAFEVDKEKKSRAIELAYEFLKKNFYSEKYEIVEYTLAILLISDNRIDEAITFLNEQIERTPENSNLNIALSRAYFTMGAIEKANEKIDLVIQENLKSDLQILNELCQQLFHLNRFEDIIRILENENILDLDESLIGLLFDSYQNLEQLDKLLEKCELLRKSKGIHFHFSLKEFYILYENKNYPKALSLAQEYLEALPESVEMKFNITQLYLNLNLKKEAEKIDLNVPLEKLSFHQITFLIGLLFKLDRKPLIEELIYKLWKTQKSPEVCELLIQVSIEFNYSQEDLVLETISSPCVIALKNEESDVVKEYIFYDLASADFDNLKEINSENELFQKLDGKQVGDQISKSFPNTLLDDEYFKIVAIQKLSTFVFSKAFDSLANEYKGETNTLAFQSKTAEKGVEQVMNLTSKMGGDFHERIEVKNIFLDNYCNYKFPLGGISNALGYPIIALWYSFSSDPKIGIKCFCDDPVELEFERSFLKKLKGQKNINYCIDPSSLLTLYNTQIMEFIFEHTGKLHMAQSTIDLIENMYKNRNSIMSQIGWQVRIENKENKSIRHQMSEERFNNFWNALGEILNWIKKYCFTPEPAELRLGIPNETQMKIDRAIGESFHDSALISKQHGYILLTDDFQFKMYCQGDLGLPAISSFSLTKHICEEHGDTKQIMSFENFKAKLIDLNYHFETFIQ